jgi:hypothetical protein
MAQKTLIQLISQVAGELSLPSPTAVMSSQDQNIVKLLALTRAVCDDLLAEFDWQQLQVRYSFPTAEGVESYPWPADVERFINGTFFDASNQWSIGAPRTPIQWEQLKSGVLIGSPFTDMRVYANKLWLLPVPASSSITINLEYISSSYVRDVSSGLAKADFANDADVCLFDHRLIVYGVKLKWLESVGKDTTIALGDFRRALEASKGSDMPAGKVKFAGSCGEYRMLSTANYPDGSWIV